MKIHNRNSRGNMGQLTEINIKAAFKSSFLSPDPVDQKRDQHRNSLDPNSQSVYHEDSKGLGLHYNQIYSNFDESFSRNEKLANNMTNHMSFLDNYTSTKYDTKSRGSKVIASPGNISKNKQKQTETNQPNLVKSPLNAEGNVSSRLYNYGFYIRNKIETQKKQEDIKLINRMKPKINKSLIIDWDTPSINLKKSINKRKQVHKSTLSKQSNSNTYQPSLNKHSLAIAGKLEPSCTRLTKKRKRYNSKNSYYSTKGSFELTYDYQNLSNINLSHSKSIPKTSRRILNLYSNGVDQLNQRTKDYNMNKNLKENEFKYFTYKPRITQYSSCNSYCYKNKIQKPLSPEEHYTKQINWKNKLEKRNKAQHDKKATEEFKNCTFSPSITPLSVENDENLISKNIDQINKYIIKRRNELEKQKEFETYKNKRFYHNTNFRIKTTHPKEFKFQQTIQSKKKQCCLSRDLIDKGNRPGSQMSIHKRPEVRKDNCDKNSSYINVYHNHFYNNNSHMESNGEIKDDQFINAVNDLHSRIENLNL